MRHAIIDYAYTSYITDLPLLQLRRFSVRETQVSKAKRTPCVFLDNTTDFNIDHLELNRTSPSRFIEWAITSW